MFPASIAQRRQKKPRQQSPENSHYLTLANGSWATGPTTQPCNGRWFHRTPFLCRRMSAELMYGELVGLVCIFTLANGAA